MLPRYKGDAYYKQFVGRCFKMDMPEGSCWCVKIIDFQDKTFIVEECSGCLGSGIVRKRIVLLIKIIIRKFQIENMAQHIF